MRFQKFQVTCFFKLVKPRSLDAISDPDEQASNGAVLFLTLLIKEHSVDDVPRFIKSLITKLRSITTGRSKCRAGILALITIAATQNPTAVLEELLQNDASFCERNTVLGEIWRKLGSQNVTGENVWNILRDKITNTETFSIANALYTNSRRSSKVVYIFTSIFF